MAWTNMKGDAATAILSALADSGAKDHLARS